MDDADFPGQPCAKAGTQGPQTKIHTVAPGFPLAPDPVGGGRGNERSMKLSPFVPAQAGTQDGTV